MENWAAEVVTKLKINGITQRRLAEKMGICEEYFSSIVNGKRKKPEGFEAKAHSAINEIAKEATT